jgi:GAF domain-containing protein
MSQSLITPASTTPARWRERTLDRLVEHARALLPVDGVTLVTVDEERGQSERAAGWFADDELAAALAAPAGARLDPSRDGLVGAALERSEPLLLPRLDAWEAAPGLLEVTLHPLGPERTQRIWQRVRSASLITCPVRSEIGSALGVLVVASLDPERPLGPSHVRTAAVVADLAAMALERAGLLESEARRARAELLLKRAAEAVSGSLELEQVYERVAEHAAGVTGATRALLTRLNSRTAELRTEASVAFSDELAERVLVLDSGSFGHVARTRAAILRRRGETESPDLGAIDAEGIGALMHAPIELGPRLYGVLTVAHEDPDGFGPEELDMLARLARSSAAAIANAIDFGRERRIARALTAGFVPESLPEVPGLRTGLLYRPAANEPTGGDVYGAWPLGGSGEVAILVGDVAGKGVETAALSAMVRFFIEARSFDDRSPARVLGQANVMLMGRLPRDTFVTAFLGVLSPGSLRYCNAGHLPPVLVAAGRGTALDSHGLPLGVDEHQAYEESELHLDPGATVFAYTDGLVEARRAGELFGSERLVRLLENWASDLHPDELVRAVHDEVAGWADGLADDTVALALERDG